MRISYTIVDGGFNIDDTGRNTWVDVPSARHNGGGTISFADGHSELHHWVEPSTVSIDSPNQPPGMLNFSGPNGAPNRDKLWMMLRYEDLLSYPENTRDKLSGYLTLFGTEGCPLHNIVGYFRLAGCSLKMENRSPPGAFVASLDARLS